MKLIYKPFGIIVGLIAGLMSRRIFDAVWAQIDEEKAPKATTQDVATGKVLAAAALQGVVFSTTRAAVNRWGAVGWYRLTGFWPGKRRQEPVD